MNFLNSRLGMHFGMRSGIASLLVLASATAAAAGSECPATFPEFMTSFEGSATYQAEHTKFPLVFRHANTAGGEIIEETIADTTAYQAIQYPSPAQQKEQALVRTESKDRGGATTIRLEKAGSESTQYRFIKTETCWQLVRMEKGAVTTQAPPVFKPFGEQ